MSESKNRHGCLTAFLVLIVIANSASALGYFLAGDVIQRSVPGIPGWLILVLGGLSLFNLVCAMALFYWRRWGFWGFVVSSAIALGINLYFGIGLVRSLSGLLGLAILYAVLQIGGENKGWSQLE